jgi:hypothetical protein
MVAALKPVKRTPGPNPWKIAWESGALRHAGRPAAGLAPMHALG